MNISGLRKNSILPSDDTPWYLPGAAAVFGLYHSILGLLLCHDISMRWMLYLDYGLFLVWMAALGTTLFSRFLLAPRGEKRKSILATLGIDHGFGLLVLLMGLISFSAVLAEGAFPGSFRQNRGCLFDAAVSFFVLYPLGRYWGKKKLENIFRGYLRTITILFSLFLLIGMTVALVANETALSQYFFFHEDRFWLNSNPNIAALTCCSLLFTGLYGYLRGGRMDKILYLICGVVLYTALMLTDSRGCILSLGFAISILAAVFTWEQSAKRKKPARIFLTLVVTTVVMSAPLACREGTRYVVSALTIEPVTVVENSEDMQTLSFDSAETGKQRQDTPPNSVERPVVDKYGSGRLKAWKTSFKALKNEPGLWLRGCAPFNIPDVLVANGVINPKNTHNQLLEIMLGYGIMPLIVFLMWLLWLAWKCVKLGFDRGSEWALRVLPVGIFAMVICNMFEARLLFYRYFIGSMFFLLAGIVSAVAPRKSKQSSHKTEISM